MNNKEFIAELSRKSGFKIEDTQNMVRTSVYNIIDRLTDGDSVSISGLGTFEVKKRMERIITNPGTGQKMLVPPKLVTNFKPVTALKEKVKG
ncbi:MAG: HU family DNA-binding protein [Prevotella sp.]|jgi:nucleoid DNA-binding protein|nr:HU family DNA-binding protein [Prevotella sp.]